MNYEEKTLSKKQIYQGNFIGVESWSVLLPNGKEATRDVVIHPGASVVIPMTEDGQIYMVRQYRKPIDKVSLEIPAGKLDKGEDPLNCAVRELKEETGLETKDIKHLINIHSAPGFTNEVLYMYVARDLQQGESCADEDEFISAEKYPVSTLVDMILKKEITDAKTIIGILLAEKLIKGEIKI
ncbi:NUDIX domain-containing protein [Acetivibrio clariflavus]|uniref:NUDIX domain-containing protein n=1 Tax=Acetivibrio clariflavus TaxID=288965 RepID=UPI0004852F9B|nr:NUDIX hydrolase [Acetivibrio clariflavus]